MKLSEIIELLSAKIYTNEPDYNLTFKYCMASDLLSDVLVNNPSENSILLTGLVNPQVVRTAEMLDIKTVVLVRDKRPSQEMIDMAVTNNIVLLGTPHKLFVSCGLLYSNNLRD